jgi:hypothetical protein
MDIFVNDLTCIFSSATNQLCLSNTGRPTVVPSASQCLNLTNEFLNQETNNQIVTVTAIQYVNDENHPALMVFGTDAAGVPLIAFGDAIKSPVFHPPTGPDSFDVSINRGCITLNIIL